MPGNTFWPRKTTVTMPHCLCVSRTVFFFRRYLLNSRSHFVVFLMDIPEQRVSLFKVFEGPVAPYASQVGIG